MNCPTELIEDIACGKCFPFIGAGFSLNAVCPEGKEMPDWKKLTKELAKKARVDPDIGGPAVSFHYEEKFGRVKLVETLRQLLLETGEKEDRAKPGDTHNAFATLLFDTIFTTNYDTLLEQTYDNLGGHIVIAGDAHLSRWAGSF